MSMNEQPSKHKNMESFMMDCSELNMKMNSVEQTFHKTFCSCSFFSTFFGSTSISFGFTSCDCRRQMLAKYYLRKKIN